MNETRRHEGTKDHEELSYAPPRERGGHYRSAISLGCTATSMIGFPLMFTLLPGHFEFGTFAIFISSCSLLMVLGLGFAILAMVKETPRKMAAVSLAFSCVLFAAITIVGQFFQRR